ncbi:MAG: hypothetical protein AAF724_21175 [Pseudomonadota bacterium]
MKATISSLSISALAAAIALSTPAGAQSEDQSKVSLELNNLTSSEAGCLATFMVKNGFDQPLEKVGYEIVLFDTEGLVERMMVLDFSPLSTGKTRVRQFDLPGTTCEQIGRVLVNDAAFCEGGNLPAQACLERLETSARPQVEFGS